MLAVGLGCVKLLQSRSVNAIFTLFKPPAKVAHPVVALEADLLDDRLGNVLDRDLLVLTDAQDDRRNLVVLSQRPDEELGKVARVDELSKRAAGAGDVEGCAAF